jgi:fibronectin type 3 domain-containing protein
VPPGVIFRWAIWVALGFMLAGSLGCTESTRPACFLQHSVTLSWTPSASSVSAYGIYRATEPGNTYSLLVKTSADTTQYTDSTVACGQTYTYFLTTFNSASEESLPSNVVTVTIPNP